MKSPFERKCLIVLGMHRSGTSALSGALEFTGFDLGKNIMPPADENPKGFFENMSIVNLNDKILEELFTSWNDTLFIPETWWKAEKFIEYADKIKAVLDEEFTDHKPLLIKDPRLCILLPLYLDVFEETGIQPVIVTCVRNPLEVADSLGKRNNLSREKSFLLWMDYQLRAELYSRNLPRIFISYADFLQDPLKVLIAVQESLNLEMMINEQTGNDIRSFLDPSLTHRSRQKEIPPESLLPGIMEFYQLLINTHLRDLSHDERAAADRLRLGFTGMAGMFNGLPKNYEAAIAVNYENKEKMVLSVPVKYGLNKLDFAVNPGNPVTGVVFRPCNARVGLKILKIEGIKADHEIIVIDNAKNNAGSKNKEGSMVFETDLPKIIVDFQPPAMISRIEFTVDYLAFGTMPNRKALWKPARLQ